MQETLPNTFLISCYVFSSQWVSGSFKPPVNSEMVIWKYHKAENLNSYKPKREIRSSPLIFLFRKLKSALFQCYVYYTGENENGGTKQIKLAPLTGNYFSQPFSELCVWISPWTYWTWRSFYAKVVSKSQLSTTNRKAAWPHCCHRRPVEEQENTQVIGR